MGSCFKRLAVIFMLLSLIGSIIPVPGVWAVDDSNETAMLTDTYFSNGEVFTLKEDSRLFVIADTEPSGDLLQTVQLLQRQFAADGRPSESPMDLVWGQEEWANIGDVVICLDSDASLGAEGYRIEVTELVKITAVDVDGLLYGGNMLLKQLRIADGNILDGFVCTDTPDTVQRAVSLDCGRKYYSKNWICNFIREISWMGYNTLELHFSDDSGFRMDIWDEAYYTETYQPANDFSWICGSNYTSWTLSAYKNDPDKGKYLSMSEVIEILDTAKEYHIEVIPAFDSPSHLDYLTWTYEQNYLFDPSYSFYSTYDNQTYYAEDVNGIINYTNSGGWTTPLRWPYYSTINVVNDHAKAFIFELYLDIADFFRVYAGSDDFSIGADEVNLNTANLGYGYSFTWGFADFVVYINELNALLNKKGYTMRMYNDFMGSTTYNAASYDFADNIEVLYWDSPFEPNGGTGTKTEPVSYYVERGSTIYNCIQTNTYYALRITGDGSDARSVYNRQWTFYHSNEEDIYNEWYPADISEHGDYSEDIEDVPVSNLGGAYFLIWCDYSCVSTEAQIWNGCYDATTKNTGEFYSLRDRMWSNITKMWNWDINETVPFSTFVSLRDGYGDFPGFGSGVDASSENTVLPPATEISSSYVDGITNYPCYSQVKILSDTPIMSLPCCNSTETASVLLATAGCDEYFTAIMLYENAVGELWYKVRTSGGKYGYLNADDTEMVSVLDDDISVKNVNVPSGHVQGQTFAVTGQLQSLYNVIDSIEISVYDGVGTNGSMLVCDRAVVSDYRYTLQDCSIALEELTTGEYTYTVIVNYQSYYAQQNEIIQNMGAFSIVKKCFLVLEEAVDQNTCDHSFSSEVLLPATCTVVGERVYLCETCGYVYEEVIDPTGHDYDEVIIPSSCLDYEMLRYHCSACGFGYDTYSDNAYSPWQEMKPDDVNEELIQSKLIYRYADYETMDSTEPVLDGYTQLAWSWKADNSGSVSYVDSWPAGFDQSSNLYLQYHNSASKVTAFENDTYKCVVDSDQISGYLYYHWCYTNSYYSLSYQSGSYTTFHAYYSTTAPNNYVCDYSDMSYRTSHSCCANSQWFFVTAVNTQRYVDYSKIYHYERWTEWSDWTEIPATATATRKVEEKTLYRYVSGDLGDHQWTEGHCVICGIDCGHEVHDQWGVCTNCGHTVGHDHYAEVTVPTCTATGFTTYACVCGNTYTAEETEKLDHSYQNGFCTLCGESEPVKLPAVKLLYPALSFEDEVKIHVFFEGENLDCAVQIGLIVYGEEVSSWAIETAGAVVPGYLESQDGGIYYCSTMGIHAKALGDRLYFSVYILTQNGEYIYSPLRSYSPAEYAYNHLSKATTSPEVKALVVAMLNYGAAAQRYFDHNADAPVNAGLSEEQKNMVMAYTPDMISPLQVPDASKNGEFDAVIDSFSNKRPAVSFKGAFSIEYFFTPTHLPIGDVQLYYWDQRTYESIERCNADNATGVITMVLREDGQYHAAVEGISAKNLDQTVFAAAVYSDGTTIYCSGVLNYHIGIYCRSFASYENNAQELAAFTAVYGYYAKLCFGNTV